MASASTHPMLCSSTRKKYLPPLLVKKGKPVADVSAAIEYLQHIVEPVDQEFYVLFEADARQRLRGRDEDV